MTIPAQKKMRDKYADKPKQIKSGKIRLTLGENNQVDFENLDSEDYNKALARAIAKDPYTRASSTFWMESKREPITLLIEK